MCVTILCNILLTSHTCTHTHYKDVLLVLFFSFSFLVFSNISQLPQAISLSTSRKCICLFYFSFIFLLVFSNISQLPQAISLSTSRKCIISNHCVVDLKTKLRHKIYIKTHMIHVHAVTSKFTPWSSFSLSSLHTTQACTQLSCLFWRSTGFLLLQLLLFPLDPFSHVLEIKKNQFMHV